MTAVIGPVGIQHTDLGHGRITLLFVLKIILDMLEILEGHSQIQGTIQFFKYVLIHIAEIRQKSLHPPARQISVTRVSGFSMPVSRESTGLMQ